MLWMWEHMIFSHAASEALGMGPCQLVSQTLVIPWHLIWCQQQVDIWDFEWNVLTTVWWIAIKFGADISVLIRINWWSPDFSSSSIIRSKYKVSKEMQNLCHSTSAALRVAGICWDSCFCFILNPCFIHKVTNYHSNIDILSIWAK